MIEINLGKDMVFKKGHKTWNKGKSWSDEIKKKISLSNKDRGHPHTEESKQKISDSLSGVYKKENLSDLNSYRSRARKLFIKMGNYGICESCKEQRKVDIHHKDGNVKNNAIDNLKQLCRSCHRKIHFVHEVRDRDHSTGKFKTKEKSNGKTKRKLFKSNGIKIR